MELLVQALAKARANQAKARADLAALRAEIDKAIEEHYGAALIAAQEGLGFANEAEGQARLELEEAALSLYARDANKHPHAAVTVVDAKKIVYEPEAALAWCRVQFPASLELNNRAFEGVVRDGVIEVPCARVEIKPQVRIKQDLGVWAGEEVAA